jgi:hypothetical protein
MAGVGCGFYTPKDSSKAQFLEANDNRQRMLASIPLTDGEHAAANDGQVDRPAARGPGETMLRPVVPSL